ncbi:MAG: phospholipid/cholesterol/gamma-HCH transport system substrate-binding protein [Solirubrobacterales bacterium]|jgi:phospholipid/cholesterol/gamma-HCH transport system substrate-binding protein|nr:phospholipid/cholesterol/gamma-HCH transport system substrate-binding protein [Solirubrobacterales bacterium]
MRGRRRSRLARLSAPAAALLLAGAAAVSLGVSGGDASDRVVRAEFTNARGLVEGNDVRVGGAPAGTVESLELTPGGTAMVTMSLHDGIEPPRADATAAIRPVDLIGDNYVALDPGTDPAPLSGPIATDRTLNAPRLDDLLRSFDEPEREGIKAILVEAGVALDGRGADLNRAALALRPALRAADSVTAELGSQAADLRRFVSDAQALTAQAASRDDDLGRLVSGLASTLRASADHSAALDAALAELPGSVADLHRLAPRLTAFAQEALPLARSLERSAPGLARATQSAAPFLSTAGETIAALDPAIQRGTELLDRADPTLAAFDGAFERIAATAPTYRTFLDALVPAAPAISKGFFVNFPDQAAEPGRQPFDRFTDPRRHYWRGAAVFSCQSFGLPIEPGCLERFLGGGDSARARGHGGRGAGSADAGDQTGSAPQGAGSAPGDAAAPDTGGAPTLPSTPQLPGGDPAQPIGDLLDALLGP